MVFSSDIWMNSICTIKYTCVFLTSRKWSLGKVLDLGSLPLSSAQWNNYSTSVVYLCACWASSLSEEITMSLNCRLERRRGHINVTGAFTENTRVFRHIVSPLWLVCLSAFVSTTIKFLSVCFQNRLQQTISRWWEKRRRSEVTSWDAASTALVSIVWGQKDKKE